ncbi:MAG: hypothetical protein Q4B26_20370 [Eubacteriales bacterium]|nr:hypothetical protein [Eubacteriales bacterium]
MSDTWGNDDFDIDERTGDFNCLAETYGYERKSSGSGSSRQTGNHVDNATGVLAFISLCFHLVSLYALYGVFAADTSAGQGECLMIYLVINALIVLKWYVISKK